MKNERRQLPGNSRSRFRFVWIAFLLLFTPMQNQAAAVSVAVFYPELGEPFRTVFEQIIQGLESEVHVQRYPLGDNFDSAALHRSFVEQNSTVIVALGQRGLKAARGLNAAVPVIAGAVLSLPDDSPASMGGFSLAPDPGLLLERLKSLAPGVRRVMTVYSPRSAWLTKQAQDAAKLQGLELIARPAGDLREGAQVYRDLLQLATGSNDAIWLPMDTGILDEAALLPLILEQAWSRNVVIFSSSLSHVPKGALFALYPDNLQLGRRLAAMAASRARGGSGDEPVFLPLRDVRTAVNLRTASHLGLDLDTRQHGFDLVFPAP